MKLFKNYLFVIAVSICLLLPLAPVKAEEEVVKCSITITSDHTSGNRAQATGPCKGYIEGVHVPSMNQWNILGIYNGGVNNGQKVRFYLPPPIASYAELTVNTVKKENPAPAPKQESKTQSKPKQETKPAETATKTETKKTNPTSQGSSSTKSTASQSSTTQPKQQTKPYLAKQTKQTSTGQSNSVTKETSKSENNVTETKAASNAKELDNQNKKEQMKEDNESVKEFAKDKDGKTNKHKDEKTETSRTSAIPFIAAGAGVLVLGTAAGVYMFRLRK